MRKKRQSPKRSCKVELDRISNLPCDIIEKVLAHLPIKEAVRTSVLSRKWRYKSARLGHLVFDRQCFSALKDASFVNIVDRVLLHHIGPIQKFKLSNTGFSPTCDIDRWILQLSRSSIKELILEIWIVNRNNRYRLPSCLYSCADMVHLELLECLLQPPLTFKGFGSLKSLDLQHVTVSQAVFENIILGCPLLEKLTLINFDGFTDLNIDAPNLQIFDVGGNFQDVNFKNTSNLAVVSVGLYDDIVCSYKKRGLGVSSNLVKFFAHLPSIQRLEIQSHFLKYLAIGVLPVELPGPCLALSYLSLRISFNHSDEISAALCLLKSCPALQELEIGVRSSDRHVAKRAKFQLDVTWTSPLAKLRLVKVNGISGMKPELEFLKLLLFSSPMLERMTVKPFDDIYAWEIVKELLLFKRASTHAEIAYLDP